MNKLNPSIQLAVVTGLNLLNDPEVRIPANQSDGISALRALLSGIGAGQLAVGEPTQEAVPTAYPQAPKPRMPRKPKPKVNGAEPPAPTVQ